MKLLWIPLALMAMAAQAADRIAILQPTTSTVTVTGQENGTSTPLEHAKRVLPKFVKEAGGKLKWTEFEWVSYDESVRIQGEAMGATALEAKQPSVRDLQSIAEGLNARFVVTFIIRELTGFRSKSFPLDRKGGRASLSLLVYDAQEKRYVWQAEKTETSVREAWSETDSLRVMQDQALFNSFRAALQPFVKEGARKEVATPSQKLVATAKSVIDGKGVLLDLGEASGLRAGDELVSLDGKCRIRVTEILANGSIAEVLEGTPAENAVFRSAG